MSRDGCVKYNKDREELMPTSIKSPPDDSVLNLWSMSELFGGGEWGALLMETGSTKVQVHKFLGKVC